jgi:dTDP-glucose pyrophosphorylase
MTINSTTEVWQRAMLPVGATIGQAIANLDEVAVKIVLVVNDSGMLEGTISDGDIRRGLLKGLDLSSPIRNVIHRNALVVSPNMERETVMQLMVANKIQQIPVVDDERHLVGLHLWDKITTPQVHPNIMVIMAGGKGTRLRPHTENCPKPMLEIGGKPMLERIIEQAVADGFKNFIISLHYLGHLIEDYFGNGSSHGINIEYLKEKSPLGTAGCLSLLQKLPDLPFIVTNGDVLTDIRYHEFLEFHNRHEAIGTMAVRQHEIHNQFGVVITKGVEIEGFEEKPIYRSHVNAGIYVLNPSALKYLEYEKHCDMPMLFERIKSNAGKTIVYPMHEPWLDVGRPVDLNIARKTFTNESE